MNILQLVHTSVEFEPATFALGRILAAKNHNVWCLGYQKPGLPITEELCPRYRLIRLYRGTWSYFPRLLRAFARFTSYAARVLRTATSLKPDVIIAYGYDVLPLALTLGVNKRHIIYYCTEYSERPTLRDFATGWGFAKFIEPHCVKKVPKVISVEHNRARLQAQQWRRNVDHIILNAPLNADLTSHLALKAISTLADRLRLVYAGSISQRNCLESLMSAVARVPTVTLDIFGPIDPAYYNHFETLLATYSHQTNYRGCVHYDDLPTTLMQYDAGVCLYDKATANTLYASPAKLIEYMRSGLLVITTNQEMPTEVVTTAQCGYVVDSPEPDPLARLLLYLSQSPAEVMQKRRNALMAFIHTYSYQVQSQALVNWIERTDLQCQDTLSLL
jgi:glycosyltransferase involved in cell wall biosynthesis